MKIVVQAVCLMLLLGGSWAVWAADGKGGSPTATATSTAKSKLEIRPAAKPESKPKLFATADKKELPATDAESPVKATSVKANPVSQTKDVSTTAATVVRESKPAIMTTPAVAATENQVRVSLDTLSPTAEMWFYEQMRQDYNNPQLQARRRAEWNAAQRRARIAAREWYGYSNSRPTAHPTPFMYYYSASWGSNTANPYIWSTRTVVPIFTAARTQVVGLSGMGW